MLRATLALALILTLSACDSNSNPGSQLDPLSQSLLRATTGVPNFGGVELRGDSVTVYTLGNVAAAQTAVASIFAEEVTVEVRSRPAQGRGSESLKNQTSATVVGTNSGAQTVDFDEATGYVRVGVRDAESVRQTLQTLRASALPVAEIIIQVELPFRSN